MPRIARDATLPRVAGWQASSRASPGIERTAAVFTATAAGVGRAGRALAAWPELPGHIRQAILTLVDTSRLDDFREVLDRTFEDLDRQTGGHNFVSLVDLRKSLPGFSRPAFDVGLRQLRLDRRV